MTTWERRLGIELAVEDTEVFVGPYSADILARDTASGNYIVIENQLGKTNHDHLGKAITYGAALNAAAIVWIASDFSDEHKKGLDWLNDNSSGDVAFFGVRLELWRINESPPAVRLNVISRPTEVSPAWRQLWRFAETTLRNQEIARGVLGCIQSGTA